MTEPKEQALREARAAHLATASADGRPHVVPIVFAWRGDVLYTPLDLKPKRSADPKRLRRVRNILANSNVAVVIDRYDEDWSRLAFVLLQGRATLLEDGVEYHAAVAVLAVKYPQYRDLPLAGRPIIRIAVEQIVRWGAEPRSPAARPRRRKAAG